MLKQFLAILLAAMAFSVMAAEKVPGVWGWIPTSTQGSYIRAIFDEANKNQDKYEFIFENRPGAGASIAARHVLAQSGTVVFANSTAQFIRPYLYPDTSFKLTDFKPVMVMGISPAALVTKGKSMDQLIKQDRINFATAGTGSTPHLMAEALSKDIKKKHPNKDIKMIHFASTNEAFLSVMGGHTDATFEYLGDVRAKATADTTLLGLTGKNRLDGVPTLASQGYDNLVELQGIFAIYAPITTPQATVDELQRIFLKAEQAERVQRLYQTDYATKEAYMARPGDLTKWYNDLVKRFESYTKGIEVK
jgi:tripartite-type tricarboxylate transporter receptor subunit TctC